MSEELHEYIVSVDNASALDTLYEKMESDFHSESIPDRRVEVAYRKPISRNTHYWITDSEAEKLKNEKNIISVTKRPPDGMVKIKPSWIQTSSLWNRDGCGTSFTNQHRNWTLLDASLPTIDFGWGSGSPNKTATVVNSSEGRNVDVIISDGMVNPNHPEFAVNADGTGGSRVIQYNWFQHRSIVEGVANGTYVYTPYIDSNNADRTSDNNHGLHVAGTVAGNTMGWARMSNIYNLNPYGTDINNMNDIFHFDYIRQFHRNKPVNTSTGRRNPTIVNCSWGQGAGWPVANISQIIFNGVTYNGPFNASTDFFDLYNLLSYYDEGGTLRISWLWRDAAIDLDIQDAINDGIIIVGAAGNETAIMERAGGASFDNRIIFNNLNPNTYFTCRGATPGASSTVISVGSLASEDPGYKSWFSNYGSRVDIFTGGDNIISSIQESFGCGDSPSVNDSRNSSHKLGKLSGTSMASPQVCGAIACALERYPFLNQSQILDLISQKLSISNQLENVDWSLYWNLGTSPNRRLYNFQHKQVENKITPTTNVGMRNINSSVKYPRLNKRKIG
jgi:hypothetical protein